MKYDIERIQKEIQEIRRKYNEQKKREQITRKMRNFSKWLDSIRLLLICICFTVIKTFHQRINFPMPLLRSIVNWSKSLSIADKPARDQAKEAQA
jgi:hypothetical protein